MGFAVSSAPSSSDMIPALLAGLNPQQRLAVETLHGPLLVLAGAGTGKTRVVTTRLAHLIATGTATPAQIFAVTFTNKAAGELKERVGALLGRPVDGWWLGTFHALAARIVRAHAERLGLTSRFTILGDDDQERLIKQILQEKNIDPKKTLPAVVQAVIARWKDRALTPDQIGPEETLAEGAMMVDLYRTYQNRLRVLNACDFGDLILYAITLLRDPKHRDIATSLQSRFRFLFVDEYQDTNTAQYLWLRLMAQQAESVCCVGDDDQSIYGWRGAEVGNILRFERDFPGATVIRLEENYRSTHIILQAASALIAHNGSRLGKTLWSQRTDGAPIALRHAFDGEDEAFAVLRRIVTLKGQGLSYQDMAILVRAGFLMRAFEDRLIQMNIPYRVVGGPRFFERAEIRDALAYLRLVAEPRDDLALERIINLPKRGIGAGTLDKIRLEARASNQSMTETLGAMLKNGALKGKTGESLAHFLTMTERWRSDLNDGHGHAELLARILDESGYTAMWKADPAPDAPARIDNLRELQSALAEFESLGAFLEHVSLVMDRQDSAGTDAVSLMTLHAAKGLEFRAVFLPAWEEGIFPSERALTEGGLKSLEEERRLAYVGLTRAREYLFISHAGSRRVYGQWVHALPSRFLSELPDETVQREQDAAMFSCSPAAGFSARWGVQSTGSTDGPAAQQQAMRVMHETFGEGQILHRDGHKCDVKFADGSIKRILDRFLTPIDDT